MWMGGRGSFGLNCGKEPVMQRYEHARWRNKQCEDSDGKEHRHHLCVHAKLLSRVQIFATPWTVALQASLSMGSPRQEYLSGLPFPPPGDLPNPGTEPRSLALQALQADSLPSEPPKVKRRE